jgi:hypothetical protein
MLFRSALIKNKQLGVGQEEKKQQNLSCLAGEIWNMMPDKHKQLWKARAQAALAEHQARFPQYKYQPAKRGKAARADDDEADAALDDKTTRQRFRERFLGPLYQGASVAPSRSRRRRAAADPYEVPERELTCTRAAAIGRSESSASPVNGDDSEEMREFWNSLVAERRDAAAAAMAAAAANTDDAMFEDRRPTIRPGDFRGDELAALPDLSRTWTGYPSHMELGFTVRPFSNSYASRLC